MTLSTSTGDYRARTITAFFDSRSDADEAVARLRALGISEDAIRLVPGYERDTDTATDNLYDRPGEGFWDSLRDFFLPDDDRDTYAEGLRRGGVLVTVTAGDEWHDRALDILDDEGTIDIDERAESWRSEGWTGRGATSGSAVGTSDVSAISPATDLSGASSPRATSIPAGTPSAASTSVNDEEIIPVVEETLRVGKRDVSHGRVRVRSYVVETPVSEQVNLREERVHIDRRPVDRPLDATDQAFQDRTIEATERVEEAVVSKESRVKEELVLRKDVQDRTETVSDRVRSTEVEIEDERLDSSKNSGKTGTVDGR
jgi:stress response protein YsnF